MGRVGVQICEVATSLFEDSKKALIGNGTHTYAGFISAVSLEFLILLLSQWSRVNMVVSFMLRMELQYRNDLLRSCRGIFKGHKGLQMYHQNVGGSGKALFEVKKSKIRVFHANQHARDCWVYQLSFGRSEEKSIVFLRNDDI